MIRIEKHDKYTQLPRITQKRIHTQSHGQSKKYSRRRFTTLQNELIDNEYLKDLVAIDRIINKVNKFSKTTSQHVLLNKTIYVSRVNTKNYPNEQST